MPSDDTPHFTPNDRERLLRLEIELRHMNGELNHVRTELGAIKAMGMKLAWLIVSTVALALLSLVMKTPLHG